MSKCVRRCEKKKLDFKSGIAVKERALYYNRISSHLHTFNPLGVSSHLISTYFSWIISLSVGMPMSRAFIRPFIARFLSTYVLNSEISGNLSTPRVFMLDLHYLPFKLMSPQWYTIIHFMTCPKCRVFISVLCPGIFAIYVSLPVLNWCLNNFINGQGIYAMHAQNSGSKLISCRGHCTTLPSD